MNLPLKYLHLHSESDLVHRAHPCVTLVGVQKTKNGLANDRHEVRSRVSFRRAELKSIARSERVRSYGRAMHQPAALTTRKVWPMPIILQISGIIVLDLPASSAHVGSFVTCSFLSLMQSFGFAEWLVCSGNGFDIMQSSCRPPSRIVDG